MMPGMATDIVGWGGVATVGVGLLPIGLPLQVITVANCTVLGLEDCASRGALTDPRID
jgi:hypothetical protein